MSFRTTKDSERGSSVDVKEIIDTCSDSKQLLISYVRAEAADHALRMKEQLSSLGFSVYLVGVSKFLLNYFIDIDHSIDSKMISES